MDLAILENNLVTGTFLAAFLSFLLFLASIVTKSKDSKKSQVTSILGYIGMIFTFLTSVSALIVKGILTGHMPWSNFYESMILMTALSTLIFLVVFKIYKHDYLGVIMSPSIVILIGIASILPQGYRGNEPLVPALQSYWLKIHVTAMIVSYSVFMLATTTAIAYLILYAITKSKNGSSGKGKLSLASTGPSLSENNIAMYETAKAESEEKKVSKSRISTSAKEESLLKENQQLAFFDELTYRLILLGFPIITFGIITGAMWANHAWGTYWSWDPKETASFMCAMFYAAYIHSRVGMNVRGRNSAILALIGFVGVIFTYYGVNYLPGLHSYGFASE